MHIRIWCGHRYNFMVQSRGRRTSFTGHSLQSLYRYNPCTDITDDGVERPRKLFSCSLQYTRAACVSAHTLLLESTRIPINSVLIIDKRWENLRLIIWMLLIRSKRQRGRPTRPTDSAFRPMAAQPSTSLVFACLVVHAACTTLRWMVLEIPRNLLPWCVGICVSLIILVI